MPFQKPTDWTGIYSIEPDTGSIDFKSDAYLRIPNRIEITIRKDAERFEAAKQFLTAQQIPYEATDFIPGKPWTPAHGTITIQSNGDESSNSPTRKLYALVCDVMDGKRQTEAAKGKILPKYVATKLHEKLFGPLLIHPLSRIMNMDESTPEIHAHLRAIHEQDPDRLKRLTQAFADVAALERSTPRVGRR